VLVHTIISASNSNGPGMRFTLWVQGCSRRCKGCFNPQTWPLSGAGSYMSIKEITDLIPKKGIEGITVSGGEPFDQADELEALLKEAHRRDLNTLVYTGYTYEQLCSNSCMQKALCQVDILIDGPYKCDIKSHNIWTGSGNQHVYLLKNGIKSDDITDKNCENPMLEIFIDRFGTVSATGIPDIDFINTVHNDRRII